MSQPQERDCVILRAKIAEANDLPPGPYSMGYLAGLIDALAAIIEPPPGSIFASIPAHEEPKAKG